jgi:DNA-binding CsgD family transcriptional regulator
MEAVMRSAGEAAFAGERGLAAVRPERRARLTQREREMLSLLAEGLTPTAISRRLYLSRRTVEYHVGNAYRKLGAHRRDDALRVFRALYS